MSQCPATPSLKVHVRWCIRRDFPEVLSIESASFPQPWSEDDYLRELRKRNCIGMVAEVGERVVGMMIYDLSPAHITVLRFAVHPAYRRSGVGRQMVAKLVGKLSAHRRTRLIVREREGNDPGVHRFWATQGFRAVEVERGYWRDTGEDAYVFHYDLAAHEREKDRGQGQGQGRGTPAARSISPALDAVYEERVRRFLKEGRNDG